MMASPMASNNGKASRFFSAVAASKPCSRARAPVLPSAIAPAASLLPSMPSVPALRTVIACPSIFPRKYRANC